MSMGPAPAALSSDARRLWHLADELGWDHERTTKRGHHRLRHPVTGSTAMISNNLTREGRATLNCEAQLRRGAEEQVEAKAEIAPEGWPEPYDTLVAFALSLGWGCEQQINGNLKFTHHVSGHSVTCPKPDLRRKDDRFHEKTCHDWARRVLLPATPDESKAELGSHLDTLGYDAVAEAAVTSAEVTTVAPKAAKPKALKVEHDDMPEPHSVEWKPWLATGGNGRYESKAVVERWVDGSLVDYQCAHPGCAWRNDDPHSVASHYRRAHRLGKGRDEKNPVTVPLDGYEPSRRLVEALMAFLAEQGDMGGLEETAIAALTWMRTRPDLPDPEPRGPLTHEQMVERIRKIVGAPDVDALEQELEVAEMRADGLAEEVERLRAHVAEVEAERDRLKGDVEAWLALAPRPE